MTRQDPLRSHRPQRYTPPRSDTHTDHVTGAWQLERLCGADITVPAEGGAQGADRTLRHGDRIAFGARQLAVTMRVVRLGRHGTRRSVRSSSSPGRSRPPSPSAA
jgi:hypothetical protein